MADKKTYRIKKIGEDSAQKDFERKVKECFGGRGMNKRWKQMSSFFDEVAKERDHQVEDLGYGNEHNDKLPDGELTSLAACFASPCKIFKENIEKEYDVSVDVCEVYVDLFETIRRNRDPIESYNRRKQLIIAATLIMSEIDRMDRKKERDNG
jgi:hypothetical protein